jgi:glutamate dehydrogenase (NAD(P)+)
LNPGIQGKKVIVEGFGNVGYNFAKFVKKEGAKIVGIVEKDAAIYNKEGFRIDEVKLHMQKTGSIKDFPYADYVELMDPQNIITKKCDILAVCATDGTINVTNADQLRCKILIEGANGAITFKADQILRKKNIPVIPDMLANSGGVVASYFEWLKNLDHVSPGRLTKKYQEQQRNQLLQILGYQIPKDSPLMKRIEGSKEIDVVHSALEEIMVNATKENWDIARTKNISLREATLSNVLTKLG